MSKKKVKLKSTIKPTKSKTVNTETNKVSKAATSAPSINSPGGDMLFGKKNYTYILAGIGLMIIGFFLMAGGGMPSPEVWDESIIYSTRRTLIAPIFILAGLVVQVFAIFKK